MAPESVKRFADEKDFGLIVPDGRSQELFLHTRAIVGVDYRLLAEGQASRITPRLARRGPRPQTTN
jgi:cold shock CspA family protein